MFIIYSQKNSGVNTVYINETDYNISHFYFHI